MAFYKAMQLESNGLWYPRAVQVDQPFTTDELADRLADISTVSRADVWAVLKNLPGVMGDMMSQGRSVRLEGLGTFRYTINAEKKGVETADKVNDGQIKSVRVRYVPETRHPNKSGSATRALVDSDLRWVRFDGTAVDDEEEPTDPDDGTETPVPGTGGEGNDGQIENPLG